MVGHLFGWGAFVSSALVTSNLTSHMLLFTSARHRHSDVPSCLEYQQIKLKYRKVISADAQECF